MNWPANKSNDDHASEIEKLYVEKFGTYTLVTPQENKKVAKYQKIEVFESPEQSYKAAGIVLKKASLEQLKGLKKRDAAIARKLLG